MNSLSYLAYKQNDRLFFALNRLILRQQQQQQPSSFISATAPRPKWLGRLRQELVVYIIPVLRQIWRLMQTSVRVEKTSFMSDHENFGYTLAGSMRPSTNWIGKVSYVREKLSYEIQLIFEFIANLSAG